MDADAMRGRALVEESREAVVVARRRSDAWSSRAGGRGSRSTGCARASALPPGCSSGERAASIPLVVPYEVDGRRERLVYLCREGDLTAYEELRAGFTAAVSHELRTPLARLLSLLETAALPGEDVARARRAGARPRSSRSRS